MNKKIIALFLKFRKFLIKQKVYLARSMSYIAMINAAMILFLMLSKLQDYGVPIYITKWFIPIAVGSIIIMLFLGYLDYKLGFFAEEQKNVFKKNPEIQQIQKQLLVISKKLDKIDQKKGQ